MVRFPFVNSLSPMDVAVPAGDEWRSPLLGWLLVRISEGAGYWADSNGVADVGTGDVILVQNARSSGAFLASRLVPVVHLRAVQVPLELVRTLCPVSEGVRLERYLRNRPGARRFGAETELAARFQQLDTAPPAASLETRCGWLALWAAHLNFSSSEPEPPSPDRSGGAESRLRELLATHTPDALSAVSAARLAELCGCSGRHFARLFLAQLGVCFRKWREGVRLQRARRLLSSTDAKVITVAQDSGYANLGLFNRLFKRHSGQTPSQYRAQNRSRRSPGALRTFTALVLLMRIAALEAAQPPAPPPGETAAPRTNALPRFSLRGYRVEGNTLLTDLLLAQTLRPYIRAEMELPHLRQAVAALTTAYRERGYVTVSVTLPPQQLTNGIVTLRVLEGLLTEVQVTGNRHFSRQNVRRALPGLTTPSLLNGKLLQAELDRANANRDRQIYPEIQPGDQPGESRLVLKVKDRFPLHGRFELNNQNTPGTPDLRLNASVQYDNLWQREHAAGLQYSFAPGAYKLDEPEWALDWPLIASYSAFYRMPLGGLTSIPDQVAAQPGAFGYDEATRQFRLPPSTGRPVLTLFGSRSTSDSDVSQTRPTTYVSNVVTTIYGYDNLRSLTLNESVGARVGWPLPEWHAIRSTLQAGLDLKQYELTAYNTNLFVTRSVIPGPNPGDPPEIRESTIRNPNDPKEASLSYLPFSLRWDAVRPDPAGVVTLYTAANVNLPLPPFSNDDAFAVVSGSPGGSASWWTLTGGLGREQQLGHQWSVMVRADGQWADGALISNEQFALGGVNSVRGYHEGEHYGDLGWRVSCELRTPTWDLGLVDNRMPFRVRASAFMEYGEAYLLNRSVLLEPSGQPPRTWEPTIPALWGTGFALSGNIGNRFDFRAALAVALNESATVNAESLEVVRTSAGSWRAHFTLGLQF